MSHAAIDAADDDPLSRQMPRGVPSVLFWVLAGEGTALSGLCRYAGSSGELRKDVRTLCGCSVLKTTVSCLVVCENADAVKASKAVAAIVARYTSSRLGYGKVACRVGICATLSVDRCSPWFPIRRALELTINGQEPGSKASVRHRTR